MTAIQLLSQQFVATVTGDICIAKCQAPDGKKLSSLQFTYLLIKNSTILFFFNE